MSQFNQDSTILFNYDDQWADLPNRNRKQTDYSSVNNLYIELLKIKEDKFIHLQQLKLVLPKHILPL